MPTYPIGTRKEPSGRRVAEGLTLSENIVASVTMTINTPNPISAGNQKCIAAPFLDRTVLMDGYGALGLKRVR